MLSMYGSYQQHASHELQSIRHAGTYKSERVIVTPQGSTIRVTDGKPALSLCANNYLGLAQHPEVRAAAREALDRWGYGLELGIYVVLGIAGGLVSVVFVKLLLGLRLRFLASPVRTLPM